MNVVTDPATAKTIYNGEFKVIVPAVDLPLVLGICRLSSSIALYACERSASHGRFELHRAGAEREGAGIPVKQPPTFCVAMLAFSAAGKKQLEALRDLWSSGAEGFLPEVTFVDVAAGPDAATAQVYGLVFDAIAGLHGASAARLLALQRQYTAFRIVHDQLQNAFDTVENFLARSQLAPIWLAFACEPTEHKVGPHKPVRPFRLSQLLPVPSQGLAAIELHTTAATSQAEGVLALSAQTCEDNRILGEWAIPYSAVPDGWIFLDLPEIDIAPRQSVLLSVGWNTQSGAPPLLSLTQLQPVPESRVRITGGEDNQRSLALRVHIGLPGSRRVAHPFHIGVRTQPDTARLGRRLAPSLLRQFAELDPLPDGEPRVKLLEDGAALEVRPVNGSMTVAKLAGAFPAESRRLTATIRTADPEGPLVEYALLALAPPAAYKPVLTKGQLNGHAGGFSGWLPIHPDFATQIHLTLPKPSAKPLDLYLATRLAEGQTAESAPARWLDFLVDAFQETAA
ncbi:MAG: DUF6212 domain-containing protein [Stellaceae bacterium]